MKNTVIKITTKKDYDAVMRKLEEMGYKWWPGSHKMDKWDFWGEQPSNDFAVSLGMVSEKKVVNCDKYSFYKDSGQEYKNYHFTTAKEFLKEGTLVPYHSPDTELIKLLREAEEKFESIPFGVLKKLLTDAANELEEDINLAKIADERMSTSEIRCNTCNKPAYEGICDCGMPPKPKCRDAKEEYYQVRRIEE